jgi:hypothetical protein
MTEVDMMAGAFDPQSLVDQLKQELVEVEGGGEDPEVEDEQWAEEQLREGSVHTSSVVQAAIDDLMPRQAPTPESRAAMNSAADRVLVQRGRFTGLLPVLLRAEREARQATVTEIAERAHLPIDELVGLESGEIEITRFFPAPKIGSWIESVPADRSLSIAALRRSLRVGWSDDETIAAGSPDAPIDVEEYVARVIEYLDRGAGRVS